VADRPDREVAREEVLGDAADVRVGPDVLGRPAARDHERRVALHVDVGERHVHRQLAAMLLGVGVGARVEVVDDELDVAPAHGRHVDLPAGLPDPVQGVHRVELLGGVAGEHEGPGHLLLLTSMIERKLTQG
jgi:hypothetical protein